MAGRRAVAKKVGARNFRRRESPFRIGGESDSNMVMPLNPLTSSITSPKKKAPSLSI
jgi:hypothetical protein